LHSVLSPPRDAIDLTAPTPGLADFLYGGARHMGNLGEISTVRYAEAPPFEPRELPRDVHAIRRILVCIDHSRFSAVCLQQAIAISRSLGGVLTLLHVMDPPRERSGLQTTDVLDWEISRQEARAYLEKLEREGTEATGQQVEIRLEQGHPAERITALARELDADLIVIGSQGERLEAQWNLGSTAQQVLSVARGSVLVARSNSAANVSVSPKRILVPLDGSLRAESVLPTSVRIASANEAELLLTFVMREPVPTAILRSPEDLGAARELTDRLEISGKQYLEGLRVQLQREGASVRTLVLRDGDERQALLEISRRERSDLIVLSAHGSTCNPELITGSVTAHLLTHSGVPLLVLQDLRDSGPHGPEVDRRAPPPRSSYPESV
jgi:nucleotide-binding universal stress UspA family protein